MRPYVEKFGVTFPVAVDTADTFGRAFGLRAVPDTFLVDEVGIVRLHGGGPKPQFLEQIERVLAEPTATVRAELPRPAGARSEAELKQALAGDPDDWAARLALADLYAGRGEFDEAVAQLRAARRLRPNEAAIPFAWGMVLLRRRDRDAALDMLRQARDLDPGNWRIRKQIWAIEHPEKFYTDEAPDFRWQREQMSREETNR